jgi:hypothetical protein
VYVAFKVVALGEKDPPTPPSLQVPPVADPPTLPPNAAEVPPRHIDANAEPALAVALQGLSANKIAPEKSPPLKVTVPLPVEPAEALVFHAAPTDPSSALVVVLSYNSVKEVGLVAAQPEKDRLLLTSDNINMAELLEVVVIVFAVDVLASNTFNVPGSTSNGPPAVPSAFTPFVAVTPEKATIEIRAISALEFGKVKVNEVPSVPSATLYKTVPCQALSSLPVPSLRINLPSINVQPVKLAEFKPPLSLSVSFCRIDTIIMSPETIPVGLLT